MSASAVAAAGLLAAGCTGGSAGSAAGPTTPPSPTTPPGPTTPTSPADPTGGSVTLPPPGTSPASPGTPGPAPTVTPATPGSPAIYRLGPRDTGKQVVLEVGDRLVITLAGNRVTGRWTLAGYPRAALRQDLREGSFGRFVFIAQASGAGNVMFVRAQCGVPPDRPCIDLPEPGEPSPTPVVPRAAGIFTVQVRVV